MQEILQLLKPSQTLLDLGCGPGSFDYSEYPFRIVGMDVQLNPDQLYSEDNRIHYVQSKAEVIPLQDGSVDLVFSQHSLEHFTAYKRTLSEIGRVLSPDGLLWIAVPDGRGFDDTLFRHIFSGGGHVNQFEKEALATEVTALTGATLVQAIPLYSGFVFLKIPTPEQLIHFPKTAAYLADIPERFSTLWINSVNLVTRIIDRVLGSKTSLYGWGLIFCRRTVNIQPLHSCFNVCWNCGTGNPVATLKLKGLISFRFGLKFYRCLQCQRKNFLVKPISGTV